jgi:hypothetical protein
MKFLFVFSHDICFPKKNTDRSILLNLPGKTFVENVAVEIGANSTNFS